LVLQAPASPLLTVVLQQIAAADVLLLSRADLLMSQDVPTIVSALVHMNSQAPIVMMAFGKVGGQMQRSSPPCTS
jgi:G3E family GTPase